MPIIQQIKVPLVSVNDTSLTVVDCSYKQGAAVQKGAIVLVLETSKTTYDVLAEADGFISYTCTVDCDYDVNDIIANIYSTAEDVPKNRSVRTPTKEDKPWSVSPPTTELRPLSVSAPNSKNKVNQQFNLQPQPLQEDVIVFEGETIFSTTANLLIAANNIDKTVFAGKAFVSKYDVEYYLDYQLSHSKSNLNTASGKLVSPIDVDHSKVIVEKLSSHKKKEITYLSAVQSCGLTSTINTNIDTEGIFVHINQSLQYLKNSLLPVIIYEVSRLLQKYKPLNAYFTGDAIALYNEVNVGFAIDMEKGLKVLKLHAAAEKGMGEIEESILQLSNRYQDDTLHVDDLIGISFTITDLSAVDVAFFTPLVNSMNSAILGISAIDEKLQRCTLSITFDHRVTDGKTVAQFLQELKLRLQSYQSKYHPHLNQHVQCFKCFKHLQDDLSDTGFSRCITPKGEDAYICQSCFKGF